MNIYRLEKGISRIILNRGYEYYQDGHVIDLHHMGDRQYTVLVEGSDVYEVVFRISHDGTIDSSRCDCPYDQGPICKHEVAAYYEVKERIGKAMASPASAGQFGQGDIKEVLDRLSKKELLDILVGLTEKDLMLKHSLLAAYSSDYEGNPKK